MILMILVVLMSLISAVIRLVFHKNLYADLAGLLYHNILARGARLLFHLYNLSVTSISNWKLLFAGLHFNYKLVAILRNTVCLSIAY